MIRAGSIIHRDQAHLVETSRYHMSWRPDNSAIVTLRADARPLWRCRYHRECADGAQCEHARPHNRKLPDRLCGCRMVWDVMERL